MATNQDVEVAGSQAAAKAVFLQNIIDEGKRSENCLMTQYWHALAAQAAASGQHMYPSA